MAVLPLQLLLSEQSEGRSTAAGLYRHGLKSSETSVVSQKLSRCKQLALWLKVDMDACQVSHQLAKLIQIKHELCYGVSCNLYN